MQKKLPKISDIKRGLSFAVSCTLTISSQSLPQPNSLWDILVCSCCCCLRIPFCHNSTANKRKYKIKYIQTQTHIHENELKLQAIGVDNWMPWNVFGLCFSSSSSLTVSYFFCLLATFSFNVFYSTWIFCLVQSSYSISKHHRVVNCVSFAFCFFPVFSLRY